MGSLTALIYLPVSILDWVKKNQREKKEAVKQTQSHEIHISVLNVMRGDRFHAALHCCTLWQLSALKDPQCSGF